MTRQSQHAATPERAAGARHHGNRYGRSEEGRLAILHAADDLLAEKGLDGVTMEGIAKRAGVGKQTIYRWWRTKDDVLLDAFVQDAADDLAPPDSGDLAGDLVTYLDRLACFLGESDEGKVFCILMARAQIDPEFARGFRSRCLEPQHERMRSLLQRWIDRGRLAAGLDLDAEIEGLVSPLFYRVLVTGEPLAGLARLQADTFVARHPAG